jgi:3-hydroxyacyl-[acyl-carrier-protein] dehydratase
LKPWHRLLALSAHAGAGGNLVYFMTIDNARFRKPVVPGDRLEISVVKQRQRGNVWKFHCEAKVEGALVAEADIGAMMIPEAKQ